jgi:MFS family permease
MLRAIVVMLAVTNLLDAAVFSVLLPVWARQNSRGPAAIGAVVSAMSATAVLGSLLATALSCRLPRRPTFLVGFAIAGAPRFVVLAIGAGVWPAVHFVPGFASSFLNPIIGAVTLERIACDLLGRVTGLVGCLAWAGIPLRGLIAAALVAVGGLGSSLVICPAMYLVATTLPGMRPEWREMERHPPEASGVGSAATQTPCAAVTLDCAHGVRDDDARMHWPRLRMASARRGGPAAGRPVVPPQARHSRKNFNLCAWGHDVSRPAEDMLRNRSCSI